MVIFVKIVKNLSAKKREVIFRCFPKERSSLETMNNNRIRKEFIKEIQLLLKQSLFRKGSKNYINIRGLGTFHIYTRIIPEKILADN